MSSITASSALVTWYVPDCSGLNGALVHYTVDVFETTDLTSVYITFTANSSFYEMSSLSPYRNYSVSVVYVNSKGAGPRPAELAAFQTLEAGR